MSDDRRRARPADARRPLDRRLCVAPMMDWTDRHCRYFHRQLAPHALLYTEMITAAAVRHGDRERLLGFDPAERPLALQLGGSDPAELAFAARIGEAFGYDEIDLNCGCPSPRVKKGAFGAALMAEPERVAACIEAMRAATRLPVTVKCRIGIDDCEDYPFLRRFVELVAAAGCEVFVVHARKAWLEGLSPKENREIPPLRHDLLRRLVAERPDLVFVANGGIRTPAEVRDHLAHVAGVMIGREAYRNPWRLAELDRALFGPGAPASRLEVVERMAAYAERQAARGVPLKAIARHMLGLFNGLPGARAWRRSLGEGMIRPDAGPDLLLRAASRVRLPDAPSPELTAC